MPEKPNLNDELHPASRVQGSVQKPPATLGGCANKNHYHQHSSYYENRTLQLS